MLGLVNGEGVMNKLTQFDHSLIALADLTIDKVIAA